MAPESRIFDRLRVFVSSRMIEMRPERDRVRAALDALEDPGIDLQRVERGTGADNLILPPASKCVTILTRLSKVARIGKIPNERGREF